MVWFRSEKRQLEANRDGIGSLGKVSQGERLPLVEGGVSSKDISRETTFDPLRNLAVVLVFFALGTRETFSPGW